MGENKFVDNDFSIVAIFNSEGKVEYLISNGMDISDRKKTEASLKQTEHELKLITEVIPQQVWTALPNGEVDYVNARWQEYAGTTLAEEALAAFNRATPDLIISDIGMPDVSGYTLITQIRQLSQGKNISAIALTAYAGEVDKQRSIEAGFQKHISKPIDIPELINTIAELI